jgi:hypothetical protein
MRPSITDRKELAERLIKKFGYDEPIFASEIVETWDEYERTRAFQIIKELVGDKILARADLGVYYFPTQTEWGKPSVLGRKKILDKKYIRCGDEVYGYYSGLKLLNGLYLTEQMPFRIEIVSSKASAVVRSVKIKNSVVTIRKSRVPVDKENVYTLMLLEAFSELREPLEPTETRGIKTLATLRNITMEDVNRYAKYFPKWALKNILKTGVQNVFA